MPVGIRRLTVARCALLLLALVTMLALASSALALLPDNRVFEMVGPPEKGGRLLLPSLALSDATGEHFFLDGGGVHATLGTGVAFMDEIRTPTGWSGVQVGPSIPQNVGTLEEFYGTQEQTEISAVSEDFSRFAFDVGMPVSQRDSGINEDIYVREGPHGPFNMVSGPPTPATKMTDPAGCELFFCITNNARLAGASADLSHIVWGQVAPLVAPPASLPGSPPDTHGQGSEIYEEHDGATQLVGLVPSGAGAECGIGQESCVVPPCGAAMGSSYVGGLAPTDGAVSGDGSQVIFMSPDPTAGCTPPEIYVRQNGVGTVQASASQRTGGDPNGQKLKQYAASAGEGRRITTVFFTSAEKLTDDANTGSEDLGNDLYAYSLQTGSLTDLTPDANPADENGASVVSFIRASKDGKLVYFTATGALAPGATSGQSNLYVRNAATGQTTYIAPGNGIRGPKVGAGYSPPLSSAVTPDGRYLVFASSESLTAYQQEGNVEIYLYDAAANHLVCVSCSPTGSRPAGNASLPLEYQEGVFSFFSAPGTLPDPRLVSDDGSRVFFSSPDQLTEGAAEGKVSAYEYESGHVELIAPEATVLTTTPSGDDVFINTSAHLTPEDTDEVTDVYDARVGGGFQALASPACSGTSCQGQPASAPIFATPASATFNGVGNFPPPQTAKPKPKPVKCKTGFVKRKAKCVRKPKTKRNAHRRGK